MWTPWRPWHVQHVTTPAASQGAGHGGVHDIYTRYLRFRTFTTKRLLRPRPLSTRRTPAESQTPTPDPCSTTRGQRLGKGARCARKGAPALDNRSSRPRLPSLHHIVGPTRRSSQLIIMCPCVIPPSSSLTGADCPGRPPLVARCLGLLRLLHLRAQRGRVSGALVAHWKDPNRP